MYRMLGVVLFAGKMMVVPSYAQSAAASAPAFEVVSIKRCQASDTGGGTDAVSPGRLSLNCVTTANLIRLAYLVFPTGTPNAPVSPTVFQQPIRGGPGWMDSERYRIDAKTEPPQNLEMIRGPMMQALLEDRFQLKLHRETKAVDVFELGVGKGGLKLQPAKEGGCVVFDRNHPPSAPVSGERGPALCGMARLGANGWFEIPGATLADLCRQLSAYVDRDIVDRTGITGVFDVHLELTMADLGNPDAAPDPLSASIPGNGGAIASALEKLGLQMRPGKSTAQHLVIDHLERPPEN